MSEVRVARLPEAGKPFYTDAIPKPVANGKDVLVKVEACSVVPNTKQIVTHGGQGATLPEFPCIFGLDVSGTVEAVGEHVLNIKVGDRVYVDPYLSCDSCYYCRQGKNVQCKAGALRGYFALQPEGKATLQRYPVGGLSEYVLSPDSNIAAIPDNIDLRLAARFGYIGTSFSGLKKGGMGPGKTLLINGVTGTLGYAAVSIALGLGCTKILGIGRNPDKLEQISHFGNGDRVQVVSSEEEDDIAGWVMKHTGGLGVDALYDCLGNGGDASQTMDFARLVKTGGSAILAAGGSKGDLTQSAFEAMSHSVSIVGTMWFTPGEIDELIALVSAGIIDLSYMQHKAFSLDQVNEAMDFVGDRPGGAINVIVQP